MKFRDFVNEETKKGWKGTVRAMITKHPDKFDADADSDDKDGKMNPWAIAHSMDKKGDKPHYKDQKSSLEGKPKKKEKYKEWSPQPQRPQQPQSQIPQMPQQGPSGQPQMQQPQMTPPGQSQLQQPPQGQQPGQPGQPGQQPGQPGQPGQQPGQPPQGQQPQPGQPPQGGKQGPKFGNFEDFQKYVDGIMQQNQTDPQVAQQALQQALA